MKKITFVLFALIAGTGFAQESFDTAIVNAEIVSPISIIAVNSLEFGRLASPDIDTDIIVSETGRVDVPGITIPGGTTARPATFEVTAGSYSFDIVYEATPLLLGGVSDANDMALVISSATGATATGDQTITVQGTLTVNANQPAGAYNGTAKVTVAYQ